MPRRRRRSLRPLRHAGAGAGARRRPLPHRLASRFARLCLCAATRPAPISGGKAHAVNESAPFEIEHRWRNLELAIDSNVDQSWALVSAWLVNQQTQKRYFLGQLESSRYYGVEGGEHWTEGSRKASTYRSSVEPGRYVLSVESAWAQGKAAPVIDVKLTQGVPRLLHFFLVVLALLAFPAFCVYRNARFETERWRESDFNPFGGSDDDDDD